MGTLKEFMARIGYGDPVIAGRKRAFCRHCREADFFETLRDEGLCKLTGKRESESVSTKKCPFHAILASEPDAKQFVLARNEHEDRLAEERSKSRRREQEIKDSIAGAVSQAIIESSREGV